MNVILLSGTFHKPDSITPAHFRKKFFEPFQGIVDEITFRL